MKLVSFLNFLEKRIVYLGMMFLLSEEIDVLMLSINTLENYRTNDNKFINGLELFSIENISTLDMSRGVAPEVDKYLNSNNTYLRKKACLAMVRCFVNCLVMLEDLMNLVV